MENLKELASEIDEMIGDEFERSMTRAIADREEKLEELSKTVPVRHMTYP